MMSIGKLYTSISGTDRMGGYKENNFLHSQNNL